jgi:hypothetical protein
MLYYAVYIAQSRYGANLNQPRVVCENTSPFMQCFDFPSSMYLHKLGKQTVAFYLGLTLYLFVDVVELIL